MGRSILVIFFGALSSILLIPPSPEQHWIVPIGLGVISVISGLFFQKSIDDFLKSKKGSKVEGGAGSYGLVAGLTQDGSITKCLTLEEFSTEMRLNLNIEKENSIELSVQSFFGPGG